ncbi:hypothetical protein [Ideonella sp. A 288]|uniref:hypothetical protein n=1 Tax=Ideonella sp. A 288 TaxID=1962181 RepID=UPI000B4C1997|nr:hypothetical protein [Ideonella sp. A 288]
MRNAIITATLLAAVSSPAWAEEFTCRGTVGAVALDNVFVPDGATCLLQRTRLTGSIVVGTGATLLATSVTVNGNIQAEGANAVTVGGASIIGGSVQIVQGGSATVDRARINGDLYFDENRAPVAASRNIVGGNLQAFNNTGGVRLEGNRMNGNLQCKANMPAPTGAGNVSPSKEDQCARL